MTEILCGVNVLERARIWSVAKRGNHFAVETSTACCDHRWISGTHLLVAVGRTPRVLGLDLHKANIRCNAGGGISVDRRLRSSNKRVFAVGDVIGEHQFTHVASYHAGIVIRNALFRIPAKVSYRAIPHVTYCDPELAHVGKTESNADERIGVGRISEEMYRQ